VDKFSFLECLNLVNIRLETNNTLQYSIVPTEGYTKESNCSPKNNYNLHSSSLQCKILRLSATSLYSILPRLMIFKRQCFTVQPVH
jgi:hypothetical protein